MDPGRRGSFRVRPEDVKHSIVLTVLVSILVLLQQYAVPWMVPK
ncbi:MAG: hypothetical protein ACRETB_10345 [Steroidobacteraceae bacterium]